MAYVPRHPSELGLPPVVWRHENGDEIRARDKREGSSSTWDKWNKYKFERIDVRDATIDQDYPHIYRAPGWALVFRKRVLPGALEAYGLKRGWWPFEFYKIRVFIHEASELRWDGDISESHTRTDTDYMHGGYHPASRTIQIDEDELRRLGLANYEFAFKPVLAYAMTLPPFVGGREVKMGRRGRR